jgi:aspartate/methionine/tyrosine aminotransferase
VKIPREFLIEDRLERYRNIAFCNLGESGIRNFLLKDIFQAIGIEWDKFLEISLKDSPNSGRWDLREEISSLYSNVSPDQILVTTGTSEGLFLLFHHLVQQGTRVKYLSPAFQALYEIPLQLGANLFPIDAIDSFLVENLFTDSDLVILNHPHNPTGKILSNSDEEYLLKKIPSYKGTVIFDEHYRFLDRNKELGFSGAGISQNVFATGSITKSFGVTGLRIGWVVGDAKILKKLRSFKDYLTHTVNPISEYLCLQLLKNKQKFLEPIRSRIQKNSDIIQTYSQKFISLEELFPPQGGIVIFPKLKVNISSSEYADLLMQHCGVFVLPGSDFEKEGYLRIGLGENDSVFAEGFSRWLKWDQDFFGN